MNKTEAEDAIAKILAQLERDSGQIVREIAVEALDVTNIDSVGRQYQMRVQIELERLPGHDW